jgi:hypothetical protein
MSEPFSWEPGDLVLVNGLSEANFQFKVRLGKTHESFLKVINKYSISIEKFRSQCTKGLHRCLAYPSAIVTNGKLHTMFFFL